MSKTTELLTALVNGDKIADFVPKSRMEAYLKNCCLSCGCDGLPEPINETDALLYALAEKVAGGGSGGGSGGGMVGGVVTVEADTNILNFPADITGNETIILRCVDTNGKNDKLFCAISTVSPLYSDYRNYAANMVLNSTLTGRAGSNQLNSGNASQGYVYYSFGEIHVCFYHTCFLAGQKYEWLAIPDDWQ